MLKSTHPTGDATEELLKNVANAKAKIHASHGGCDLVRIRKILKIIR